MQRDLMADRAVESALAVAVESLGETAEADPRAEFGE